MKAPHFDSKVDLYQPEAVYSQHVTSTQQYERLCLNCKGITIEGIRDETSYYHHHHDFHQIVKSALTCAMCELIRDGLRQSFPDPQWYNGREDALDLHLEASTTSLSNHPILIRGDTCSATNGRLNPRVGFKAFIPGHVSCIFNRYPSFEEGPWSPVRPIGLKKLELAREWLSDSSSTGPLEQAVSIISKPLQRCRVADAIVPPTRLLDLGIAPWTSPQDLRLCLTDSMSIDLLDHLTYATLSHRWGNSQHLRTTQSNLSTHHQNIHFADLPGTFRDAVILTRYLEIRYLWIDALCIVQDDILEWHREAIMMGNIYKNAKVTIAVHHAGDDSEGFLHHTLSAPKSVELGYTRDMAGFTASLRTNFKAEVERSPLSARGWVLQERFLSQRTLHFTSGSIFFEDEHGVKCEEDGVFKTSSSPDCMSTSSMSHSIVSSTGSAVFRMSAVGSNGPGSVIASTWCNVSMQLSNYWSPMGAEKALLTPSFGSAIGPLNIVAKVDQHEKRDSLVTKWLTIVERYSRTQLTMACDKLPAIAGLASYIQEHTGVSYYSGIWADSLHSGLLWMSDRRPLICPKVQRAPSWSWASVDGPLRFPSGRIIGEQPCKLLAIESSLKSSSKHGLDFYNGLASLRLLSSVKKPAHFSLDLSALRDTYKFKNGGYYKDGGYYTVEKGANIHLILALKQDQPLIWFSPTKRAEEALKVRPPHIGPIGWASFDCDTELDLSQVVLCYVTKSWKIHHVLLLVKTGLATDEYRRVGVGEVWQQNWFDDVRPTAITLV
ncbi:HET-domain-containing protein [Lophium mytilinum]|uniref:HET-domain-containing protein n=1 Tax=Lophium mytilinum TaxID=390894 RepID=A0A6A6QFQ9_9PEZI|nr:HET-domain-containing protein [Lophium mytilinum]